MLLRHTQTHRKGKITYRLIEIQIELKRFGMLNEILSKKNRFQENPNSVGNPFGNP